MGKTWTEQSQREKSGMIVKSSCSNGGEGETSFILKCYCLSGISCLLCRWVCVVCFVFHQQEKIFSPVHFIYLFILICSEYRLITLVHCDSEDNRIAQDCIVSGHQDQEYKWQKVLQKGSIISMHPPTGKLNLMHCIVCCAYQSGSINVISDCAAFLHVLGFWADFLCTAFFPACLHTFYLVSKYTAEFINLLKALHTAEKVCKLFFPVLISCSLPKCTPYLCSNLICITDTWSIQSSKHSIPLLKYYLMKILQHIYQYNRHFSKCCKGFVAKLLTRLRLEQNVFCYRSCLIMQKTFCDSFIARLKSLAEEVSKVIKMLLNCKEPYLKRILAFYTQEFLGYSCGMLQEDTEANHRILYFSSARLKWVGSICSA